MTIVLLERVLELKWEKGVGRYELLEDVDVPQIDILNRFSNRG